MTIDLIHEAGDWPQNIAQIAEDVEEKLFAHFGLETSSFETTILLTNDMHIQKLNQEFRDKNKATDVLSWPAFEFDRAIGEAPKLPAIDEGPFDATLGDIALSLETCQKDADGKNFDHHISHLILHGFLHLLGYDHEYDSDAVIMEALEVEILKTMFIDNPYKET